MKGLRKYLLKILNRGVLDWMPDAPYLKIRYYAFFGKRLRLRAPITFNEKLQWLKLHDRNPVYSVMADKYEVKKYVTDTIGSQYVIPALGVWNCFDEIDFDALPQRFVLKCTHDSGGLVICRDKSALDKTRARVKIEKCLDRNYYFRSREWPYKNIAPRVLAEEYLSDGSGEEPRDYKVFCFGGTPRLILVCQSRFSGSGLTEDFYDTNWQLTEITRPGRDRGPLIPRPVHLEEMLHTAAQFAAGIPFLRVDFYDTPEALYFGEFTFFPSSGFVGFEPEKWDETLGKWIDLRQ